MWSHHVTVKAKAGYLPKEKEQLNEELFPQQSQFYDIIREREDIYHEFVVAKKMRTGQIPNFDQVSNPPLNRQNSLRLNASENLVPENLTIKKTSSPKSTKEGSRISINADAQESELSFENNNKILANEKEADSDTDSFIPSESNNAASSDILKDIADADKRDEDAYF